HVELALAFLGVVASEAVFLEDRGHVVDEADRALRRRRLGVHRGRSGKQQCYERQGDGRTNHAKAKVVGSKHRKSDSLRSETSQASPTRQRGRAAALAGASGWRVNG